MNVCVVGIGAMGGGMAHAMLESSATGKIVGFDRSDELVGYFHSQAVAKNKCSLTTPPKSLQEAIVDNQTDVVVLVLVNEGQCNEVCFGSAGNNILECLKKCKKETPSCVILCSTVSATWARSACEIFQSHGILFVDCPISGGPVRARSGDLTMMASGSEESLSLVKPLLNAMGKEVHIIDGGAGMGSTVKVRRYNVTITHGSLDIACKINLWSFRIVQTCRWSTNF
jgi:putative dehydrogenase